MKNILLYKVYGRLKWNRQMKSHTLAVKQLDIVQYVPALQYTPCAFNK